MHIKRTPSSIMKENSSFTESITSDIIQQLRKITSQRKSQLTSERNSQLKVVKITNSSSKLRKVKSIAIQDTTEVAKEEIWFYIEAAKDWMEAIEEIEA
jgi:TolB-like protein